MSRYIQTVSPLRNWAAIFLLVLSNSFGNLFLALGMKQLPDFFSLSLGSYILNTLTTPWVLAGVVLLAFWMFTQLAMLTWADLTYVLPVTGIGYALTALLGFLVLGEVISTRRWIGIGLISTGVILVAKTSPRTAEIQGSDE